ncbi:MAG: hypothetical protein HYZ31_11595 [Gammaproteobacteria bacterium]|nr:hypothetical protein [Gammaproteobacteria bacterium]
MAAIKPQKNHTSKFLTAGRNASTNHSAIRHESAHQSLGNQAIQHLMSGNVTTRSNDSLHSQQAPASQHPPATFKSGIPRIHENSVAQTILSSNNKLGAALGQDILLANNLGPIKRQKVLRHEMRHAEQVNGGETNFNQPIRRSKAGDVFERNASQPYAEPRRKADPQTIRFFGEEDDVCSTDTILSSSSDSSASFSSDSSASSVDTRTSGALSSESSSLTSGASTTDTASCEPLESTADPDALASYAEEPGVCEAERPSFDADAIDVAGMRNDELNTESLRVDEWFSSNADSSHIDRAEYVSLRSKLKTERTVRVQNGHLWLTTATRETPDTFYMLQPGGDLTAIISVYPEIALGVPDQSFPGPIMTVRQFQDHMGGMGIPIYTEEEYLQRLQETYETMSAGSGGFAADSGSEFFEPSVFDDDFLNPDPLRGYVGGIPLLDTRASLLAQTLPYGNANVRAGDIGEAFGLSAGWDNYIGRNYNSAGRAWSGDFLRPFRPLRGAEPVADIRVLYGSPFDDLSLKVTRPGTASFSSPSARTRFATYLAGHADILDTSATKFQSFASTYRPGVPLADVSDAMGLAIPENHVADYRALLMDPTGFDLTNTGALSVNPNYSLAPLRQIYSMTRFDTPIAVTDGGAPITNGAELYAARDSGRITATEFDTHIRTLGVHAAARVVAIPGMHTGAISWYEGFRSSLGTTDSGDLRAALDVNTLQTVEEMRMRQQITNPDAPYTFTSGRAESASVAMRNAGYGGAARAGFSLAGDLIFNDAADLSDPRYRAHLIETGVVQGVAGATSEFGESYLRSRAGLAMAREGLSATAPRALAMRIGARAVPGVVDSAVEIFDMATDDRDNSTEEVIVRTGRAAVIGAGSAWAGAAIGTAIGGPVGFVVGFAAGALVGWLGNKLIPGGADYWQEQERIRLRVEELERRVAELERRVEEMRERRARLDTPLDSEAASVAGVESLFGLPTTNPMFISSSEDYTPTVGDLESEYLVSTLMGAEGRRR